jgi:hypothetical protein
MPSFSAFPDSRGNQPADSGKWLADVGEGPGGEQGRVIPESLSQNKSQRMATPNKSV